MATVLPATVALAWPRSAARAGSAAASAAAARSAYRLVIRRASVRVRPRSYPSLLVTEGLHGEDARGPARGDLAREHGGQAEDEGREHEGGGIRGADLIEHPRQRAGHER